MGELWFVGLGLAEEPALSPAVRAELAGAELFAEEYTATAAAGALDRLATDLGRPIARLDRAAVEGEDRIVRTLGAHPRVALLVVGDPFAATTHVALRLAVERAGHSWRYLPGASILTAAAGLLGLMAYRFGRPVSLPFLAEHWTPRSPIERIAANRSAGAHTLVLLDLRPDEGRTLTATEGLAALRRLDPDARVLADSDEVAVAARVGRRDAAGFAGPFGRLATQEFGPPMHAIVVPAPELHFEERAALERFRVR